MYQASDNYRKILEGLSKSLAEIGDIVHLSVQHAKLVNTSDMQEAVSQLYASVFLFLREAMFWYTSKRQKRLLKSFDENFYDKFSGLLEKIYNKAQEIHIRGNIGHHAKVTDIIHTTSNMDEKLDRIMITQEEERRRFQEFQISQAFFSTPAFLPSSSTIPGFRSKPCRL